MAAVTIEDCLKIVPNRFELALIASYRAEQLANGAPILYTPKKMEKNTVVALREIAAGLLDVEQIREEIRDKMKSKSLFANFKNESVDEVLKDENLDDLNDINLDDDDNDLEDINSEDEDEYYDDLGSEEIEDDEK